MTSRSEQHTPNGTMLYIAGPMTGLPDHNKAGFAKAAEILRNVGYVVISPPEMDEIDGVDLAAEHGEEGWMLALERDLVVVGKVDGLAVLDGWSASRGARLEVAAARGQCKPVQSVWAWAAGARR